MAEVRAKEALFTKDGVRAHNEGDPVPPENVAANGWQDKVTGYTDRARKQATSNRRPRPQAQVAADEAAANPPEPEK